VTCSLTCEWVGTIAPRFRSTRAIISFRPVTTWRLMTSVTGSTGTSSQRTAFMGHLESG
jgi:hypothetical protein